MINNNNTKKVTARASGGIYGLAFVGALIYYMQHATSFGDGVLGLLKACVWPAVLVYKIMEFIRV